MSDHLHTSETPGIGLTSAAAALAYAGALPLIIIAVLVWARPDLLGPFLAGGVIAYGGVLIAFFGGVRWGVAVMRGEGPSFRNLIGAILPLLLALAIFMMTFDVLRLALIVIALPLLLADDLHATKKGSGAPGWYLAVRLPLTVMLEIAFAAILARVLFI